MILWVGYSSTRWFFCPSLLGSIIQLHSACCLAGAETSKMVWGLPSDLSCQQGSQPFTWWVASETKEAKAVCPLKAWACLKSQTYFYSILLVSTSHKSSPIRVEGNRMYLWWTEQRTQTGYRVRGIDDGKLWESSIKWWSFLHIKIDSSFQHAFMTVHYSIKEFVYFKPVNYFNLLYIINVLYGVYDFFC